jgi:hypothetical protein
MNDYLIFTTIFTILFWVYVLYRIAHPFECTCGGCVAKKFKLIVIVKARATQADLMMGKTHIFYLFYL